MATPRMTANVQRQPWYQKRDGAAVALLCIGATVASAVLAWSGSSAYRFLLGDLDPVLTTVVIVTVGAFALAFLVRQRWFEAGGGGSTGRIVATLLGSGLTIPVVIVDWLGGFPPDLNVAWPDSLLFYPSIALIAEFSFHVVPLAVFATALRLTSLDLGQARLFGMIAVSTIEPAFQVAWGSGHSPYWANAYVGVHLLVFNLLAVGIFRRYGFLNMYLYRVAYYLVWHVVWGHLRLGVLFGGDA